MINENILGIVAGILTSISMLPQLIKVLKEKNVDDLSPVMLLTLILGLSLWVWYGIMKSEAPIIYSNAFATLMNICLLVSYLIYRKKV
jgi:Uncharacterized conserved protein